jgi:hypothetical protein
MNYEWGFAEGDTDAAAIIADRRVAKKSNVAGRAISFFAFMGSAVWYANHGTPSALAMMIALGAAMVICVLATDIQQIETYALITERRAQLLEQKVQALQNEIARWRAASAKPSPNG